MTVTNGRLGESGATLAFNPHQATPFEAQILIHAVIRSVDPFLNSYGFGPSVVTIEGLLSAQHFLAYGLSAFLLHFECPVPRADQLVAAAQR